MTDPLEALAIRGEGLQASSLLGPDARGRRHLALRLLDAEGVQIVDGIASAGPARFASYTTPHRFVATDGATYWVKHRAQEGLGAECIAARLAEQVGIGPRAAIIRIGALAVPVDGSLDRFLGTVLGLRHVPDVLNADEMTALIGVGAGAFDQKKVDAQTWADVTAFQTWINAEDSQVFVRVTDGHILSADHGACFGKLLPGPPRRVVTPRIPGITEWRCDAAVLERSIARIEGLTEVQLLQAAAGIPEDGEWRALFARRLAVVEWLIKRQMTLREVMLSWAPRVS